MKTKNLCLLFVAVLSFIISPPIFSEVINSQPKEENTIDGNSKALANAFVKPKKPQERKEQQKAEMKSIQLVLLLQPTDLPNTHSRWLVRDLSKNRFVGEKKIVVDPVKHTWTAYSASGKPLRSGIATAGAAFCPDIGRRCRTQVGVFRIQSLGTASCKSKKFPVPRGGAPMPYCMFFNGGQGLHGSYAVVRANVSHGCIRMRVEDARWVRFNFATIGTKVIIKPY